MRARVGWIVLLALPASVTAENTDGLLVWYRFDEGHGALVGSATGQDRQGECVNEPDWIATPWGRGLRFDDRSYVQAAGRLDPGGALTVEAMVRWEADPAEHGGRPDPFGAVIGRRYGATGYLLGVGHGKGGRRAYFVINGLRQPDGVILVSDAGVPAEEWTYLAATYDGKAMRLWVNDTVKTIPTEGVEIRPCPRDLTLGAEYPGSDFYRFRGGVDEVRIWERALSPEEVSARYQALRTAAAPVPDVAAVAAVREVPTKPIVVAQDGSGDYDGDTGQPIREAIAAARGGGTVLIKRGVYTVWSCLRIGDQDSGLTLRGEGGAVLRLPPLPHTTITADAEPGAEGLQLADASVFRPGMRLRVKAPGRTSEHAGRTYTSPTYDVLVRDVRGDRIELTQPLAYHAPGGAAIALAENLLSIYQAANVTIENLVFDGGKQDGDPTFVGHMALCTLTATGPYSYEKGPTGEPVRGLRLRGCTFRRTHGRCIAWYSVVDSEITDCLVEDTPDAGIDIDHFCYGLKVTGNTIRRCGVGIEINDGSRCDVGGNRVEQCGRGVVVWQWCRLDGLNEDNRIHDNEIRDTAGPGVLLETGADRNTIRGNQIVASGASGIILRGNDCMVEENTIEASARHGIEVAGSRNTIRGNRCRGNSRSRLGAFDGINVAGTGNRIEDNVSGDPNGEATQRHGVHIEGDGHHSAGNDVAGNLAGE